MPKQTKKQPAKANAATKPAAKPAAKKSAAAKRAAAKPTAAKPAVAKPAVAKPAAAKPAAAKPVSAKPVSAKPAAAKPAAATPVAKPAAGAKPAAAKPAPAPSTPDDRWWGFIERARKGAEDEEEMTERLGELLEKELTPEEIIQFDTFVNERIRDAFRGDLWGVAYIMNGGCSDDGFDYFCGWLVGKGKAHYYAALANPEDAAKGVSPDDEPFENEDMWYVAARAWESKTDKSTDEFHQVAPAVERELQGELFDEETIGEKYPKLARKFGGG
jgi:hypothetical protein